MNMFINQGDNMISIIMPLYNAERFLNETLQSIRNQTYTNYELICVDDCSTDRTFEMLQQAMKIDGRIRLLHNNVRSGAAVSRNKGMEEAKGEYLAFLDGDDIFEEEMLEKAYQCAKENDLDIVIYEELLVSSEKIHEKKEKYRNDRFRKKLCQEPFSLYEIEPSDYVKWSTGPWNKLFKREFIKEQDIKFQSLSCCNDVYFVEMAYILAKRILFLDDARVMVYVRQHSAPSRISSNRDLLCAYSAGKKIAEAFVERQIDEKLYQYSYLRIYQMFLSEIVCSKKEEDHKRFYQYLHDSGIAGLIESGGKGFCKCFERDSHYLRNFVEQEYSTKWFDTESMLSTVLKAGESDIWKLWTQYKNIAIWGIGRYGRSLLKLIAEKNLNVCCVIDRDLEKSGTEIEKYRVYNPKDIQFENIDVVLIAIKEEDCRIKNQLSQYKLKIIDIKEYM